MTTRDMDQDGNESADEQHKEEGMTGTPSSNTDPISFSVSGISGHAQQGKHQFKLRELICWRQLEGRQCFDAQSRALASSTDVVIVMLYPSRKNREGQAAGSFEHDVNEIRDAVATLQANILSSGIRVIVDSDEKSTARAKFVHWEACGVALRLELGLREVRQETASLWVHRAYDSSLHAAMASPPPEVGGMDSEEQLKLVDQRVHNLPIRAVIPFCKRLLQDIASTSAQQHQHGNIGMESPPRRHAHAKCIQATDDVARPPSPLCMKLHLANELTEAADTDKGVCIPHLCWLTGRGRPCYCTTQYHPSMDELKECVQREVERMGGIPPGKQTQLHWANDDAVEAASGSRKLVVVGNIPSMCQGKKVSAQLQAAFAPYHAIRVYGSKARREFSHGWARVLLPSLADAQAAVENLDGKLEHLGRILTVAMSAGRLDTLFPMYPYEIRSKLRVGSVAAFSVTDQTTANAVTMLTAAVAGELLLHEDLPNEEPDGEALLPLVVTDGTACSGGNTLSLMTRFAAVHAVEIDEDRVADLRHNVDLVLASWVAGSGPQVTTHHGEFLSLMADLKQDILVLDPPWGGPSYNEGGEMQDLYLSNTSVSALAVEILMKQAPMLVVRLPHILKTQLFLDSMAVSAAAAGSVEGGNGDRPRCGVFYVTVQLGRSVLLILTRVDESERREDFERRLRLTLRDCCHEKGVRLTYSLGKWHDL